jgi:hypothetical protein
VIEGLIPLISLFPHSGELKSPGLLEDGEDRVRGFTYEIPTMKLYTRFLSIVRCISQGSEAQNYASEIKIRAQRLAGPILKQSVKETGGQPYQEKNSTGSAPATGRPGKLEISDVLKCFFAYSSGVVLSSAEWGLRIFLK